MDKPNLMLISERAEDIEFAKQLAQLCGADFKAITKWEELVETLAKRPNSVLIWDADGNTDPEKSKFYKTVLLKEGIPGRVFVLTDKTVNQYPDLFNKASFAQLYFHHNLIRRYGKGSAAIYSRVIQQAFEPSDQTFVRYFPPDTKIQRVLIQKSAHRKAAVDATESFLSKTGINPRLASKIAQATDELLMNAIFDAARDKNGAATRQMLDRKALFDLSSDEPVELMIASTEDYVGICVTDIHGSVSPEVIMKFINQDYHDADYKLRKFGPGAGLGLYGIVQAGISLILMSKPHKKTHAMLFFPNTSSYKAIKEGFLFTACFIGQNKDDGASSNKIIR